MAVASSLQQGGPMIFKMLVLLTSLALISCSSSQKKNTQTNTTINYFENAEGCFLLYNMKTDTFDKVVGEDNCKTPYTASSTFKVPLSVMAFDSKVLKDENEILKWDGKKDIREVANKDHNAKTWMSDSIVWFSQRLTPKIGKAKMQSYLDKFQYGNRDLSGGLTEAWHVSPSKGGTLTITGYEQIEFMKKLWRDQLPASKRSMQITRDLTYLETSPNGYELHGKTGSNYFDTEKKVRLGWFISHIHKGKQEYIAVTNFRDLGPQNSGRYGGPHAKEITKKILADLNLW